jgi:purine-binding chemotaxis protein CheW
MAEPFILFEVAGTNYAVQSAKVQQIEMIEKIVKVPNAPDFVEGVVYIRGRVVPVVNLRSRFGFEKIPYDLRSRLIVINLEGRLVGLAVDSSREFVFIDPEKIMPSPDAIAGVSGEYLSGTVSLNDRLVLILNLNQALSSEEKEGLTPALGTERYSALEMHKIINETKST